ncbi:MAG TPA: VpsF family polysaccharide biosynthesis protein [Hyphomicrobium sp.]|nr:VpsF family polysaccharide biosynthesis protein [Hyphomicrobium sp.]
MPAESRLLTAAIGLFAVLMLALSPFALSALGYGYSEAGGNALTKFHPSTYYLCALAAFAALATGDPLAATLRALREAPSVVVLGAAVTLGVVHAMLFSGHPITPLIETFVPAMLILLLLRNIPEGRGRALALLLHSFMALNAGLGIFEALSGWRLTPLVLNGEELTYEWRSSALLGHPLANAMLTGSYLLILAFGGGRDLPAPLRIAAFGLNLAAMAMFGGRAATVLALLVMGGLVARRAFAVLNGAPVNASTLLLTLAGLPFVGAGLFAMFSTNFLERFLRRFSDDAGSAQARNDMFEIFSHVQMHDLLIGPDPQLVATWQGLLGLDQGIESFWLAFVLFYGLVVSVLIFGGLFLFCREIALRSRSGAGWVLAFFIAVASVSTSLSGKSNILTVVTLFVLVLMRPGAVFRSAGAFTATGRAPGTRRA